MLKSDLQYTVIIAKSEDELRAAQRLRYDVFVTELGGDGSLVDHDAKLERDRFDPFFDHLLLLDQAKGDTIEQQVVGVYRVLREDQAKAAGQFYSEDEFDLTRLKQSGRKLLELGRSCLHPAYRGGAAMLYLWNALGDYVVEHEIEILFGTASFQGVAPRDLAQPLSMLHHRHLAPEELRVTVREPGTRMDLLPPEALDRPAAMLAVPALIKAYLRLGGCVGNGAYIDYDFKTIDVCLILDTARMNEKQKNIYSKRVTK